MMASFLPEDYPTCPVCLESPAVERLSICKHVFCQPCISKHLSPETKVIRCLTCQVESPLLDDVRNGPAGDATDGAADVRGDISMAGENDLQCRRCKYKKSADVKAEGMCEECGQFPLCGDCILIHRTNDATQDHTVLPLKNMRKSEVRCEAHDQLKKAFCKTCSKLVCHVCVMIEHEDHAIKKWSEVCREIMKNVVDVTAVKSAQLADLKNLEARLKETESSTLAECKALTKNIEEHAEKWLEETLRQKTALIATVNAHYKVFDWSASLDKIANAIRELEGALCEANRLVPGHIPHPGDLETLFAVHEKLSSAGMSEQLTDERNNNIVDDIDNSYQEAYKSLQQKQPTFVPDVPKFEIGKIEYKATMATGGGEPEAGAEANPQDRNIRPMYSKEFRTSIISLANFGDGFAVAYGRLPSTTYGLNIYDFPCRLRWNFNRAFSEDVQHLAATPDGNIAALCDDTETHLKIKKIDPETANVISSCNIPVGPVGRARSLGVTGLGHYVILHNIASDDDVEDTRISVYKQDGSFVLSRGVGGLSRFVSCNEKTVFISGGYFVDAYELNNEQLVQVATGHFFAEQLQVMQVSGVSTAPGGEVVVACEIDKSFFLTSWYIGRATLQGNKFSEWDFQLVSSSPVSLISVAGGRFVFASDEDDDDRKCLRIWEEREDGDCDSD